MAIPDMALNMSVPESRKHDSCGDMTKSDRGIGPPIISPGTWDQSILKRRVRACIEHMRAYERATAASVGAKLVQDGARSVKSVARLPK
jgi:hypothetical protein